MQLSYVVCGDIKTLQLINCEYAIDYGTFRPLTNHQPSYGAVLTATFVLQRRRQYYLGIEEEPI